MIDQNKDSTAVLVEIGSPEGGASQALVTLSDAQIATIKTTIAQAEKLVQEVLERDVDYGIHPGTDSMALKDSGGSKVANAFNCYPEHAILHVREDDEVISYLIQAKLINRATGRVVAIGVGACSTMESKYGYRWVDRPEDYGLDTKTCRYKKSKGYRIPNPDVEDLGNTILKMACKRAEIDATQSLPGVGSALKKLFMGKGKKLPSEPPNWQTFWVEVSTLGLSEDDVHRILGVKSLKEGWLAKGKSLNEAVRVLAEKVAKGEKPQPLEKSADEVFYELGKGPEETKTEGEKPKRDPKSVTTGAELLRACFDDFGLQPEQVYAELNINNLTELTETPTNAYIRIAAARK